MTTVITRYFDSGEKASAFRNELLHRYRVPANIIKTYDDANGMAETLTARSVNAAAAKAYEQHVASGGGEVVMVRAQAKPLGVARITRETAESAGATPLVGKIEESFVREGSPKAPSIISGSPLMMTRRLDAPRRNYHMANWPIPLISRRPANDLAVSLFDKHARMADAGLPLISKERPFTGSIVSDHGRMASWPIGLLVPGNKYMAKFPFGHIVPGHKFMAKFPFAHLVPGHKFMAKFPFGHLVPRGWGAMAGWPFPHLINGKQGRNSLVPGHKFMARFPFDHLVPGHKRMASFPIGLRVPGNGFMASFPIKHLVPGHRRMASWPIGLLVPGHRRMANIGLPLTIRHHKQRD